jgi:TolB-like protein
MRQALERAAASSRREGAITIEGAELGKLAAEVAEVFGEGYSDHQAAAGKPLVVIPFAAPDAATPGAKFAHEVFLSLFGRLSLDRRGEVGVVSPLRSEPVPAVLLARANTLGAKFILAASPVAEGDEAILTVKLFSVAESAVIWTESFPIKGASDAEVAGKIAAAVMERVPRKETHRKK